MYFPLILYLYNNIPVQGAKHKPQCNTNKRINFISQYAGNVTEVSPLYKNTIRLYSLLIRCKIREKKKDNTDPNGNITDRKLAAYVLAIQFDVVKETL